MSDALENIGNILRNNELPEVVSAVPDWLQDSPTDPCLVQITSERPVWATLGNFGPLGASQGMTRPVTSQFMHLKAILVL